jgi:hypothetical protein
MQEKLKNFQFWGACSEIIFEAINIASVQGLQVFIAALSRPSVSNLYGSIIQIKQKWILLGHSFMKY